MIIWRRKDETAKCCNNCEMALHCVMKSLSVLILATVSQWAGAGVSFSQIWQITTPGQCGFGLGWVCFSPQLSSCPSARWISGIVGSLWYWRHNYFLATYLARPHNSVCLVLIQLVVSSNICWHSLDVDHLLLDCRLVILQGLAKKWFYLEEEIPLKLFLPRVNKK